MNHGEIISDNDVRIRDVSLNGLTPELSNCILNKNGNLVLKFIISPNEWAGNFGKAPCITAIDFFMRDNKLLMHVLYRSQNIFTKQPGNLLGLNQIHEEIAKAISVDKGPMELYVCSAHIYECDFGKVNDILKQEKIG